MFGNGKVFVSHTHEDNAACAPVLAALDAWQVDYWFDLGQLSAGLELLDTIERAQEGRDIFLRICTPAAQASPWMAQERKLARSLRAPSGKRRMIDLIVKPGYVISPEDAHVLVIDATQQPEVEWLRQLREALEIPSRERRVSRRAALGVGITSLAALGGMGFASKLLFFTPPAPNIYLPTGHQPTPTALPGASRIRWTFALDPLLDGIPTGVALAGEKVILNNSGIICALSRSDGKLLWSQQYYALNTDAPPTVVGDTVYSTFLDVIADPHHANAFLNNVYLVALNASDGSERWRQLVIEDPSDTNKRSAIAVAANTVYMRYNQALYAFDSTTGKVLWNQNVGGSAIKFNEVLPAPTVAGGTVFTILGDQKLHAFSASTGAPLWPAPFASDLPIRTQPVVAGGVVYVGADGGWCYALDATTGATRWKTPLLKKPDPTFTLLGLNLSDNVLYISGGFPLVTYNSSSTLQGTAIQALDSATGKILWSNSPDEQLKLNGLQSDLLPSSALVAGNKILVATRMRATTGKNVNILFALDKTNGKVSWSFQMWGGEDVSGPSAFPSAPVISGDTLFIASGNETLYAISYAD